VACRFCGKPGFPQILEWLTARLMVLHGKFPVDLNLSSCGNSCGN
jgi:sulfite reductase beta subunit-like hemoprotein